MAKIKSLLENELVIAVDFDGTITNEGSMTTEEPTIRDNCAEVLNRLSEDGVKLILWTCRSGNALTEALDFLDQNGLLELFDTVNEQLPEVIELFEETGVKVGADLYIDDKNIMYKVDWKEIEKFIYSE